MYLILYLAMGIIWCGVTQQDKINEDYLSEPKNAFSLFLEWIFWFPMLIEEVRKG